MTTPPMTATRDDEQLYFDHLREVREAKREARSRAAYSTGDLKTASRLKANFAQDATLGGPEDTVAFLRVDLTEGDCVYVGNNAIQSMENDLLVQSWKSTMVMRLREATPEDPGDVVRHRKFRDRPVNTVADFEDLILADIAQRLDELEDGFVATDALLQGTLDRERSPQMREIIQTIQAAQSRLIRTDADQLLVVQGGPGTGKTAVALHRVSWLLYNVEGLAPEDILVIGPNKTFTKYIEQVFVSLGDSHVPRSDLIGMLQAQVTLGIKDNSAAAKLKGEQRMGQILTRGLLDRIKAPAAPVQFKVENVPWSVTITPSDIELLLDDLGGESYAQGRTKFREQLLSRAGVLIRRRFTDDKQRLPSDPRSLLEQAAVDNLVERCWPQLSAQAYLRDLFGSRDRLLTAGGDDLSATEIQLLHRQAASRLSDQQWSKEDAVLLDFVHYEINGDPTGYKHIVVDEAQDLSPMQLVAVRRRSANGAFTIVGDIAQSTGHWARNSWDDITEALRTNLPWSLEELDHGYRVPRKIMDIAAQLLPTIAPGITSPTIVRDVDQLPQFVSVTGDALVAAVADCIQELAKRGRFTGVICPDARRGDLERELYERDVAYTGADGGALGTAINIISPTAAKGLEFDAAVVVDPAGIVEAGPEGLRMLYIALTRTTRELAVVYPTGTLPSLLHGPWAPAESLPDDTDPTTEPGTVSSSTAPTELEARLNLPAEPAVPATAPPVSVRQSTTIPVGASDLLPAQRRIVEAQATELLSLLEEMTAEKLWGHALRAALSRLGEGITEDPQDPRTTQ